MTLVSQHIVLQSPANNDPLLDLNTQPSLDLQFATSKTLDDRVSGLPLVNHQRDASSGKSAGTYVGSDGLIKTSAVNLATYSEDLTQRTKLDTTTPTATLLQATAQSGPETPYAAINTFVFPKTNTAYTVYADFEKVSIRYAIINFQLFSVNGLCVYDLDTGTVSNQPAGFTCSMPEVETGVYRCTVTHTTGADTTGRISFGMSQLPTIHRVTDPTTSDQIIIHRIQIEEGPTASDYIPTTTVASGAPRFDHDPVTGESLGLLIEESRTNAISNSSSPTWNTPVGGTGVVSVVTTVSDVAPDGTINSVRRFQFDRGTGNTSNDYSLVSILLNGIASSLYANSVWLKSNDANNYTIQFYDAVGLKGEEFVITPTWQRFKVDSSTSYKSSNPTAATGASVTIGLRNAPGSANYYTGDNNSQTADILAWGPQIEAGSFPTSYIPTSGSTVPREADVATIEGTDFSSWYNQSEGTLFVEADSFSYDNSTTLPTYAHITDGTLNNYIRVNSGPSYKVRNFTQVGGVNQTQQNTGGAPANNVVNSIAVAIAQNNSAIVADGGSVLSDTSYLVPTVTKMEIGNWLAQNDTYLNGHISRLTYYPYRLADATLQEITS